MSDMIEDSKKPVPETDIPAPHDAGRRRLLQGGLGVAPVVLTLASRSTFGGTLACECATPSGFVSGNTSKPGGPATCGGLSPGYWWKKPGVTWPLPFVRDNLFYSYGFVHGTYVDYSTNLVPSNPNPTMMDVMSAHQGPNPYDPGTIGFHIIAALLNQAAGLLPPFITPSLLYALFNQVATTGYYLPVPSMPSIQWSASDVVNYLVCTGIAP
jgi:hypothetical protein